MFSFWKKKKAADSARNSEAPADVVQNAFDDSALWKLTAAIFAEQGHRLIALDDWLKHPESGFLIRPELLDMKSTKNGVVQSSVLMRCQHPTFLPKGVFEYQHSMGESAEDAITQGIEQWAQMDFVTLLDSLAERPGECTFMEMNFDETESEPARIRRVVLGPVAHLVTEPAQDAESEEHPFCACCLFTQSIEAFMPILKDDGVFGVRLFAARAPDGAVDADCRINGNDYEPGAKALRAYAKTWPQAGLEFRKQYIVIQTVENSMSQDAA